MTRLESNELITEDDAVLWLNERVKDHTAGMRRTDDLWPDDFWDLADKVAEQGCVRRPEDIDRLMTLFEKWQNEQNAAENLAEE